MVSCGPTYQVTDHIQMYNMGDSRGPFPQKINEPTTLAGIISNTPQFSKFRYILRISGLEAQYNTTQPWDNQGYTLFVPDDQYLQDIPQTVLVNMDKLTAREIIQASTLNRRITAAILQDSPSQYLPSYNRKYRLLVTNPDPLITLINNDIVITQTDISSSNGIIHVTNGILWPYPKF